MNTPSPIILDLEAALDAMGGDREIFEVVLATYLQSTPSLLGELENALRSGDRSVIKRCAHSIKSSSLTMGGMQLGAAAAALEQVAGEATATELGRLAAVLHIRFAELTAELGRAGLSAN